MLIETIWEENGDTCTPVELHRCDRCGKDLPYNAPREEIGKKDYCGDCAFILGLIDEKALLNDHYYFIRLPGLRSGIHEDKVYIGQGKFEWERTSRDRESKSYREWRERVYERDNWTCQECGQYGGKLNAHHIQSYAHYPELRLNINNGITLCISCHKKKHRCRKKEVVNERC